MYCECCADKSLGVNGNGVRLPVNAVADLAVDAPTTEGFVILTNFPLTLSDAARAIASVFPPFAIGVDDGAARLSLHSVATKVAAMSSRESALFLPVPGDSRNDDQDQTNFPTPMVTCREKGSLFRHGIETFGATKT